MAQVIKFATAQSAFDRAYAAIVGANLTMTNDDSDSQGTPAGWYPMDDGRHR
jgi:hypothetical protein